MEPAGLEMSLNALTGLLGEFRKGNIVNPRVEAEGMKLHAGELSERWDRRFTGFPQQYFPFTSLRGEHYRGRRDAHLRNIIVQFFSNQDDGDNIIVNPACVFGRHARNLASRLPHVHTIGTDIFPFWNRIYALAFRSRTPENFTFTQDDIFKPKLKVKPKAVVFFGACGSVSDGAIDYAIRSGSPYIMCRTCCHDNIGGNTEITHRNTFVNWFFRFKNREFERIRRKKKYAGLYFSDKYPREHYPQSQAAKAVTCSDEFMEVARNSAESDICRTIIDLDRCLYLMESGYNVSYRGELFVAERILR